MGSRRRPTKSPGVQGYAYMVPGGQGVGLLGPRGSTGWPRGSLGVIFQFSISAARSHLCAQFVFQF